MKYLPLATFFACCCSLAGYNHHSQTTPERSIFGSAQKQKASISFSTYVTPPLDTGKPAKGDLKFTLQPVSTRFKAGMPLELGFRITNISNHTIYLPHTLENHVTLIIGVKNSFGNNIHFTGEGDMVILDGPNPPDTSSLIPPPANMTSIQLDPGEFWGSEVQIKKYPVIIEKPGTYRLDVFASFPAYKGFPKLWCVELEAHANITITKGAEK